MAESKGDGLPGIPIEGNKAFMRMIESVSHPELTRLRKRIRKLKRKKSKDKVDKWIFNKQLKITRELLVLEEYRGGKSEKLMRKLQRRISGEEVVSSLKRDLLYGSKKALQFFNEQKNTDFEFVKLVGGFRALSAADIQHVNFLAKTKDGDSPKLFFAELNRWLSPKITECCILKPGATIGCGFCDPEGTVGHPPDGFQFGRPGQNLPYTTDCLFMNYDCPFTEEQYRRLVNFKC